MSTPEKSNFDTSNYDPSTVETEEFGDDETRGLYRKFGGDTVRRLAKEAQEYARESGGGGEFVIDEDEIAELTGETPKFGVFRKVEFHPRYKHEKLEDYNKRAEERRERKMWAALMYGPDALREQDFEFRDEEVGYRDLEKFAISFGELPEEEFEDKAKAVIENIETPFDREGAEGCFEKVAKDRAALEVILAMTHDDWSDNPDAWNKDLDLEKQREFTIAAIKSFMKRYPTAADLRRLEREAAEMPRFKGTAPDDMGISEEYRGQPKFDIFQDALDRISEKFYGMQEEYMRTAEAIYFDAKADTFEEGDEDEDVEVVDRSAEESSESSSFEARSESPKKSIESDDSTEVETTETETSEAGAETRMEKGSATDFGYYDPARAARRFAGGTYVIGDYGYDTTRKFSGGGTMFTPTFTPKFGGGKAPEKKPEKKKDESELLIEKLTPEELKAFEKEFKKSGKLGSKWRSPANGIEYELKPLHMLNAGLGPNVKLGSLMLSKPFRVGEDRLAIYVYFEKEDPKENESKYGVYTVVQDSDGDFGKMSQYYRVLGEVGKGKSIEEGIDWEKTDEISKAISEDSPLMKAIRTQARIEPIVVEGDPEFFAAGTAEKQVKIDS